MASRLLAFHELSNQLLRLRSAFYRPFRSAVRESDFINGDAYLVTAHAAIEFFFEDVCRRALHKSLWAYSRARKKTPILEALLSASYYANVSNLPRQDMAFGGSREQDLANAVKWYVKRLDTNNGLKRVNLLALLLPLGFTEDVFDPVWLASMDSLGQLRGDTAHGRPALAFGRAPHSLVLPAQPTVSIAVWTNSALRKRLLQAPWDVEATLQTLLPEIKAWDLRLLEHAQ